jgi:anti-sigma regulatory factor (Ser/Thr protein kinase)
MSTSHLAQATTWITAAATLHGEALPEHLMQRLGIGRRAALSLLRKLEAAKWLVRSGTTRRPCFAPGALRQVVHTYPLAGLEEDIPWSRDFAPYLAMPPNVSRMAQHAFSELLNNAIDHSGGTAVTVSMRQTAMHLQLLVSDDGCGLFQRIEQSFAIHDPQLAMFELSKGKLTSLPEAHTGRGLYFTSRLADFFHVHANHQAFQRQAVDRGGWARSRPMERTGTSVYMAIALDTPRTLDGVMALHSVEGAAHRFDATTVPLRLLLADNVSLESRAQARRVSARLPVFRRAEVDFTGVDDVGHAFADELFRVFRRAHPDLDLVPVGMAPRVASMIDAVQAG